MAGMINAALSAVGNGIQSGMSYFDRQKGREFDEKRLSQQADIANQNNMRALIIQELRNAGVLQQIDARGDNALQLEGVRGGNAQDLERTRQGGRVDLSNMNFGHDMALTGVKEAGADTRNIRDNTTRRYGIDTGATTQRRGQDVSAGTQRRGQDLSFDASTYATDSANRRTLVPRPNTAMPFGGVNMPQLSYDKFFEAPPAAPGADTLTNPPDPSQPVSAQPQIQQSPKPGPAVAPIPPRRATPGAAPVPPAAAPMQSPGGADRVAPVPQAAAPRSNPQALVGKSVKLRDGRTVVVKKINPDGTFDY